MKPALQKQMRDEAESNIRQEQLDNTRELELLSEQKKAESRFMWWKHWHVERCYLLS